MKEPTLLKTDVFLIACQKWSWVRFTKMLPYVWPHSDPKIANGSTWFHILQKSGWRVFYLLNGMCLSQPSSLYQRCFLFPLLKGPGFPAVFLENFPMFEGFLRAKCFPTVKGRAQGCQKKEKNLKSRRQTHTPGKNTCDRTLQICIKHAMCFSQWYVPVLIFYFILFYFFLPGGPGEEPLEFLPPEVP